MHSEKASYRSVAKSTAVFGGSQVVQMFITLLRAKMIAVILGSIGMGYNAIFQSTLASINTFSSFGIFQSAIRNISQANSENNKYKLGRIATIFERLVWFTGLLGFVICLVSSPLLSKIAFDNYEHVAFFVLLAFALPLMALSNGKVVFLQGTRHLSYLAKSSLIGAFANLLVGIPLYYYLGIKGIVLSIVFGYLLLYLTNCYYVRKIDTYQVEKISFSEAWIEGKPIVKLGIVLMLGTLSINLFTYLTNVIIGRIGSIDDVGRFQAATSIITQSIIVVVTILASDFYPRLSAACSDKKMFVKTINLQAEIVSLIIAPIVVIVVIFAPAIVNLLLSSEFLVIVPLIRLMALTLLLRGIWLVLSYIILAKGDKKSYLIYDALLGNGLNFIFNIVAYYFFGLQGLGLSFMLGNLFVSLILLIVVILKYDVRFDFSLIKIFSFLIILCVTAYVIVSFFAVGWLYYTLATAIILLAVSYSLYVLNLRIGLIGLIKNRLKNK